MSDELPSILTVKEVADKLRLGLSTVYKLFNAGHLRGFRTRGNKGAVRIFADALPTFLERNANAAAAARPVQPVSPRPFRAPQSSRKQGVRLSSPFDLP